MLSRMEEDLEAGRSYATIAATFIRNPITSLEQKEDREEDNASYEASTEFRSTCQATPFFVVVPIFLSTIVAYFRLHTQGSMCFATLMIYILIVT